MDKHSIGPWYIQNGSLCNRISNTFYDEDIAMLIETNEEEDTGILHKVGRFENVSKYFDEMTSKLERIGMTDSYKDLHLIQFNVKFEAIPDLDVPEFAPEGYNFTVDEICTIVNWFNNSIGGEMGKFLALPLIEMKNKIQSLQRIGF